MDIILSKFFKICNLTLCTIFACDSISSKYFMFNTVLASDNAFLDHYELHKTALTPQAVAARTKLGINSLCPPDMLPIDVGN